jgi:hypothetical protein
LEAVGELFLERTSLMLLFPLLSIKH